MVNVTRKSPFSGKENTMTLNIDEDTLEACIEKWNDGMNIQDAFPMLDADEREFIKTGITPAEWDATFFEYLNDLRDSGVTNMFGASPYLVDEFGLSKNEARKILMAWMNSFNEN
jgi:hypothetical protein